MADLILALYIIIFLSLNVVFFRLHKKGKLNLMLAGFILLALAPIVRIAISEALLQFVEWGPEETREGAGYGGVILQLVTFANGVLLLVIGVSRWLLKFFKKNERI